MMDVRRRLERLERRAAAVSSPVVASPGPAPDVAAYWSGVVLALDGDELARLLECYDPVTCELIDSETAAAILEVADGRIGEVVPDES